MWVVLMFGTALLAPSTKKHNLADHAEKRSDLMMGHWRIPFQYPYDRCDDKGRLKMLDKNQEIEFSIHDIEMIKEALFTQEKILAVQSRAGGNTAKTRLNELRELLGRMRTKRAGDPMPQTGLWGQFTRVICS
jgi:hypothetical protein